MKLKIELTDKFNVTSTVEQYIDLANPRSVQDAFVAVMRILERGGWVVPADLAEGMAEHTAGKDV